MAPCALLPIRNAWVPLRGDGDDSVTSAPCTAQSDKLNGWGSHLRIFRAVRARHPREGRRERRRRPGPLPTWISQTAGLTHARRCRPLLHHPGPRLAPGASLPYPFRQEQQPVPGVVTVPAVVSQTGAGPSMLRAGRMTPIRRCVSAAHALARSTGGASKPRPLPQFELSDDGGATGSAGDLLDGPKPRVCR